MQSNCIRILISVILEVAEAEVVEEKTPTPEPEAEEKEPSPNAAEQVYNL